MPDLLADMLSTSTIYIIDSMPIPVCRRARAKRCTKVAGVQCDGTCYAKHERYFGWKLHLVCDSSGIPIRFVVRPARLHDTTAVDDLACTLPFGIVLLGDRGYVLKLGPAWLRDCGISISSEVAVTLDLEGPQEDNLADDIVAALKANPTTKAFFDGLPTFYRKKYLRWINGTKGKPDVRAQRIAEMITLLAAGQRER